MELTIRPSTQSDLPELLALYSQPDMGGETNLPLEQAGQVYDSLAKLPDTRVYVAEIGGQVAGTFTVMVLPTLSGQWDHIGVIEDVVVKDTMRRLGVGRAMMEYAREYCREKGCYKVMLSSGSSRPGAHSFYESLGFQRYGIVFTCAL